MAKIPDFVSTLGTAEECENLLENATRLQRDDICIAARKRLAEIEGRANEDPSDPIVRAFHEMLAVYESLLSETNGRRTRASRTRQMLKKNKHPIDCLVDWARGKTETKGFQMLIDAGFPEYTGEFIVVRFAERFPEDVVVSARQRLEEHEIALPDSLST